jgi:hypothetical protein
MWRLYCNKPSVGILERMAAFENCEDRQAVDRGKFDPNKRDAALCSK